MFRRTPEELQLIQLFQTTRVSETRRWSGQRYMVVNTRVAGPWNLIAEIITIPLQIIAAIPFFGLPALLILWLFGLLWVLLSHVITLPVFVVASLLIGETSAGSRRHSSKHEVADPARGRRRTIRRLATRPRPAVGPSSQRRPPGPPADAHRRRGSSHPRTSRSSSERREGGMVPPGGDRALSPPSIDIARRGLELAQSLDALDVSVGLEARTVRLPDDRSMGILDVRSYTGPARSDWSELGEARGPVSVPAGTELRLRVSADACRDLSPLAVLNPNDLQELILTAVGDAQLPHLRGLTGLKWLGLGYGLVTDAGLSHIEDLTKVEHLELCCNRYSDAGLAHLHGLANLWDLELWSSQITDAGLAHLSSLIKLRWLDLTDTQITDAGLVHLTRLTNLEWLFLSHTQITDAGLAHLSGLTKLRWLSLEHTGVADPGLVHLEGLTKLRRLDLTGTQVTEVGVARLRAVLPDCGTYYSPAS